MLALSSVHREADDHEVRGPNFALRWTGSSRFSRAPSGDVLGAAPGTVSFAFDDFVCFAHWLKHFVSSKPPRSRLWTKHSASSR